MKTTRLRNNLKDIAWIMAALICVPLALLAGAVWYALFGLLTSETPISARMQDPNCEFIKTIDVHVGGHRVRVDAHIAESVRFVHDPDAHANYISTARTPEGFGFCKDFVPRDRPAASIEVRKSQARRIATELGLPFSEGVHRLSIGARGFSRWMRIPREHEPRGTSAVLVRNEDFGFSIDGLTWEFLFSEGWIEGSYRVSSWCAWRTSDVNYSCSFRIETRKDRMIFEAYGLSVDELPTEGSRPPEYVAQIAQKLPNLLTYLEQPRVSKD